MTPPSSQPRAATRLTFKGNLARTRYGWLRLTPAYSVHLVGELLDAHAVPDTVVLDPFCGTGTTALACAERGLACDTTDINPFLLWLTATKTRPYDPDALDAFRSAAAHITDAITGAGPLWTPPLHRIERWWDPATLAALGRARAALDAAAPHPTPLDLLKLALCRVAIERARISFGHQSMSFSPHAGPDVPDAATAAVVHAWRQVVASIAEAAASPILRVPRPLLVDARRLGETLPADHYDLVVTSPPYPNRMSYVRELRPYMYWLGYLRDGRAAGELDWQAIGGTWGIATSNLTRWAPDDAAPLPLPGFADLLEAIAERGPLLARYVHKYVHDVALHARELARLLRPGGVACYVVGNSKFYDTLVPTETIYATLFAAAGLGNIAVRTLRKRTSKRELYEFLVTARKPS